MRHEEASALLAWYVNSTLEETERRALEEHVAGCPDCRREIEELNTVRAATIASAEQTPEPSPFLLTRALQQIDEYERGRRRNWWSLSPRLARLTMAVQFALVLALGVAVVWQARQAALFTTASGPRGDGARLVVGFAPTATEEAMRRAIQSVGGRIIDGPSALGLYTVRVSGEKPDFTVDKLRADPGVVRFVERAP